MNWSHFAGAVAGLLSLLLAIPGYVTAFSPMREFLVRRKWIPYGLILAMGLCTALSAGADKGWFDTRPAPLRNEYDKTFDGGVVVLDGHAFYNCKFNNVIFHWDGGPSFLMNPRVTGARGFQASEQKIILAVDLLKKLGLLDPYFAAAWTHDPVVPIEHK
jgi:hypothetical protein